MKTVILRHRRENLKKCSLRGLEKNDDFLFFTYPQDTLPNFSDYLLLKVGAPPLTKEDTSRGIFLIDGTWRLAQIMEKQLPFQMETRSLPTHFKTAYPRRQEDCPNPEAGLASIEALYITYYILGRSTEILLDNYYWKKEFIGLNVQNFGPNQ